MAITAIPLVMLTGCGSDKILSLWWECLGHYPVD